MATIAVLITDLYQDTEFQQPDLAFTRAGHHIDHIGLRSGHRAKGLDCKTSVLIDREVETADSENYDALFIPGGYSPDRLRENDNAIRFVREFMNEEKSVFVINNGLQMLISARMLAGRRVAGRKSLAQDIANAGGFLAHSKVMVDGNLISCSSDTELPTFIIACLQKLSIGKRKN